MKYESAESPKLEKDCQGESDSIDAPFIWIYLSDIVSTRTKYHEKGREKREKWTVIFGPPTLLTRFLIERCYDKHSGKTEKDG